MASPRIEYAVLPAGDGPGQDRCFTADGLVVVLDGASAYDPSVSPDATDYVDTLGPTLIDRITGHRSANLRDSLADAIRYTARKLSLVPGKCPSSTVSVVRWDRDAVDVLVLGDSPVTVQYIDGRRETLVQHPMDHIAPNLRQCYRERLAAGYGYDAGHRSLLQEIQRREAPLRNVPEGYWIAEAEPLAADAASRLSIRSSSVSACVLESDGIAHLALALGLDAMDLIGRSSHELERCLAKLQAWESDRDPNGAYAPRSKVHDDKTIAILEGDCFGEAGPHDSRRGARRETGRSRVL
jgi:hypothetical protein